MILLSASYKASVSNVFKMVAASNVSVCESMAILESLYT